MDAVEASLRRLNTDYIDLYQIHWPDPETPILETLQALDDLVRQGKVRYIGECNFGGWQIADVSWTARSEHLVRPISPQREYSMLRREAQAEILPAARAMHMGFLPYFPLASGFLTGKYRRGQPLPEGARLTTTPAERAARTLNDHNFALLEKWQTFATERGRTMTELAIAWLLAQPGVSSVIAGATRREQVDENVAVVHGSFPRGLRRGARALTRRRQQTTSTTSPAPGGTDANGGQLGSAIVPLQLRGVLAGVAFLWPWMPTCTRSD